jgi:hypothetical protein
MTTPQHPPNPFALDQEFPFLDAAIVQSVTLPTMLQWEHSTGGFFVEAENPLPGIDRPATFVTKEGKRIKGFAAKTFRYFPVAFRNWWEIGEPGKQQRLTAYQDGAHSRTQALGVLFDGTWVIITARGLASQGLVAAIRSHRYWTGRNLRAQPFASALEARAGEVRKEGATYVTEFNFATAEELRCEEALGWKIRERWNEVQGWIGQENKHAPILTPPAAEEFEQEVEATQNAAAGKAPEQKYGDKTPVNSANADEVKAFEAFQTQKKVAPASREALREWVRNGRK